MTKKLDYAKLTAVMQKLDAQISAAEAHGLLMGMFCLSPAMPEAEWRAILLENLDCTKPNKKDLDIFVKVARKITADFNSKSFTVQILLPDDQEELRLRLEALADWCRGYLSGLALVGITAKDLTNEVVNELVQDLAQIAQVDHRADPNEEAENNYMELVEYVRIAVQNIQSELHDIDQKGVLH